MASFTQVRGGTSLHLRADIMHPVPEPYESEFLLTLTSSTSSPSRSLHSDGSTTPQSLGHADYVPDVDDRRLIGSVSSLTSFPGAWRREVSSVLGLMGRLQLGDLPYWSHEICAFSQAVAQVISDDLPYTILIHGHFDIHTGAASSSLSVDPVTEEEEEEGTDGAAASSSVASERREDGLTQSHGRSDDDGLDNGVVEQSGPADSSNMPVAAASVAEENLYVNVLTTSPTLLIDDYFGRANTNMMQDDDEIMLLMHNVERNIQAIAADLIEFQSGSPPPAAMPASSIHEALRTVTYDAGERSQIRTTGCAVCFEDFDEGAELSVMPCSHAFHRGCLLPWLARSPSCPLCRFILR